MGSLKAKPQNDKVILNWMATSMEKTASFLIQRSENGSDFNTVGQVAASPDISNYSFMDSDPLKEVNYYRLKLVDKNKADVYSAIAKVSYVTEAKWSLYPNPATSSIVLSVSAKSTVTETVTITSLQGTVMKKENLVFENGLNQKSLNISSFPAGVYLIKIGSRRPASFLKK
jgi:hypothetical protein